MSTAALASATKADVGNTIFDGDNLDEAAMGSDSGVDDTIYDGHDLLGDRTGEIRRRSLCRNLGAWRVGVVDRQPRLEQVLRHRERRTAQVVDIAGRADDR